MTSPLKNIAPIQTYLVYVRFPKTKKGDRWIGVAAAPDLNELFWAVDRLGDPLSVEIANVGSRCICVSWFETVEGPLIEVDELCDGVDESEWFKPDWPARFVNARKSQSRRSV